MIKKSKKRISSTTDYSLVSKKMISVLILASVCWFSVNQANEKQHGIKRKAVDNLDIRPEKKYARDAQSQLLDGIARLDYDKVRNALEAYHTLRITPPTFALVHACDIGDLKIVRLLVEFGVKVNDSGTGYYHNPSFIIHGLYDSTSKTPLIAATVKGDEEIVFYLLSNGADINGENSYGNPLLYAIETRQPTLAIKLIERGANVNARCPQTYISPLARAVLYHTQQSDKLITTLLDHGAIIDSPSVNKTPNQYMVITTPIQAAISTHNNKVARYFMQKEPKLYQKIEQHIETAAHNSNEEMVYQSLSHHTDVYTSWSINLDKYRNKIYQNNQDPDIIKSKLLKAYKINQMIRARHVELLQLEQ